MSNHPLKPLNPYMLDIQKEMLEKRELYRNHGQGGSIPRGPQTLDVSDKYDPENRRNNKTMGTLEHYQVPSTRNRYKNNPMATLIQPNLQSFRDD